MSVGPPRPKGPPLNAMRAFESAARHESFVVAAEELSVTPGAISQHVKTLEGWAGLPLFRRNAQGVELTSAGHSVVTQFVRAFDAVASATHALRNLSASAEIHIAALPCVAQLWLPARLGQVRARYPHLKFSVTAMETAPSLTRELFDLSVFFATPDNDPEQFVVASDEVFPVSSPVIAEKLTAPEQLNSVTLLQDQTWRDDWVQWSDATSVRLDDPTTGPYYSLYSLAVEEAKSGAGVLMGHACLIGDALKAGTLVPVFRDSCETGKSLVLTLPPRRRRRSELEDIAALLIE